MRVGLLVTLEKKGRTAELNKKKEKKKEKKKKKNNTEDTDDQGKIFPSYMQVLFREYQQILDRQVFWIPIYSMFIKQTSSQFKHTI